MNTLILSFIFFFQLNVDSVDYLYFHQKTIEIEELIAEEKFNQALKAYQDLFEKYDFVFKRDLKIASDLALYLNKKREAKELIIRSLKSGWELKDFQKGNSFNDFFTKKEIKEFRGMENQLKDEYLSGLNINLRQEVHQLFKNDQKKALGAFMKIGDKAQDKYANSKFAPHSEEQLKLLKQILIEDGYPGERLIGNNYWGSTIVSHHNSITYEYVKKDTLFEDLKPLLLESLKRGEISPYEIALMEDWKNAVLRDSTTLAFGYLNPPTIETLQEVNRNREKLGLRSIDVRNKLVVIEEKTGMNFYLPDWVKGKIQILEN